MAFTPQNTPIKDRVERLLRDHEGRLFMNLVPAYQKRGLSFVTTSNHPDFGPAGSQTLWLPIAQNLPIGEKSVRSADAARKYQNVEKVVVVSECRFTKNAETVAKALNVELISLASFEERFRPAAAAEVSPPPDSVDFQEAGPSVGQAEPDVIPPASGSDPALEEEQINEAMSLLSKLHALDRQSKLKLCYWKTYEENGRNHVLGNPYKWQVDFHNAGSFAKERGMVAANRVGKTQCAAAETAMHLTGEYPPWWRGKRFVTAIRGWVGSDTNETSRDIVQAALLGDEVGTGWLPADKIVSTETRQCGISGVIDTILVKHISGGVSRLVFKTYEQGRKKWQGTSQHIVWLDEEPPHDVYTEALTRTLDCQGTVYLTFTPLSGASTVVMHLIDGGEGIYSCNVGWDDAPHLREEDKRQMLASYPEWERETRSQGVPLSGSGVVYPVGDDLIECPPFDIPDHFRRICGIDFGIDHPAAGCWLAHDADRDVIYVYDAYKMRGQTPAYHAEAIKSRGETIPVAWPHDGMNREKSSGEPLMVQYKTRGVMMLPMSARYDDDIGGPQPTEPVVLEIDERMRTGRFKVFAHLHEWFREKRMYHRKDAQIVRENDDIMAAMQYGVMMKRFGRTKYRRAMPTEAAPYDPFSYIGGNHV